MRAKVPAAGAASRAFRRQAALAVHLVRVRARARVWARARAQTGLG